MPRSICVVVTARASYARIKSALRAIAAHPDLELRLVVAASALLNRYGDAASVIRKDGFGIDAQVYSVVEGETPLTSAKSTGMGLIELATCLDGIGADAVVTIADRYETLATAIAASYMNLPLIHIQGGEVTGSIDEKVRHAVTKLADLHLVATEGAAERVMRMGEASASVHVTGCPSIDLAAECLSAPSLSANPTEAFGGVGPVLDLSAGYLIAMQHPVATEYEEAHAHVTHTLEALDAIHMPTLWFWPNVDAGSDATSKGIRTFRERHRQAPIHFFRNLAPEVFLRLAKGAKAIVGNSSFGIREASFLGLPTVNIGSRQSGRERADNVIDVDYEPIRIAEALRSQLAHGPYAPSRIYGDGRAGSRIAEILADVPLGIEKRLTY